MIILNILYTGFRKLLTEQKKEKSDKQEELLNLLKDLGSKHFPAQLSDVFLSALLGSPVRLSGLNNSDLSLVEVGDRVMV